MPLNDIKYISKKNALKKEIYFERKKILVVFE